MGLVFFVCLTLDCLSHIFKPLHPFIKQYTLKKVCKIKKAPNLGGTTCKREKKKLQAKKE